MERTGGNGIAEPEAHVLPDLTLAARVVSLISNDQNFGAGTANPIGNQLVIVGQRRRGIDDEEDDIGLAYGLFDLTRHLGFEFGPSRHPAAGVDDEEWDIEPLSLEHLAVTSDARPVFDNCLLAADNAVEQCRFSNVRATDDDDARQIGVGVCWHHLIKIADRFGVEVERVVRELGPTAQCVGGVVGTHAGVPADCSSAARSAMPSVVMTSTGRGRSEMATPSRKRPSSDRQTSGSK